MGTQHIALKSKCPFDRKSSLSKAQSLGNGTTHSMKTSAGEHLELKSDRHLQNVIRKKLKGSKGKNFNVGEKEIQRFERKKLKGLREAQSIKY